MIFTAEVVNERGERENISYRDGKRRLWLAPFIISAITPLTVAGYFLTGGNALATLFPLTYFFVFVPLLDAIVGEDTHNPPEAVVPAMSKDRYYARLLYITVGLNYVSFILSVWLVGTQSLPVWSLIGLAYGVGLLHGNVLNIGHELGHKNDAFDQFIAKISNAMVGYGHFCIEHNRGHHVWVSTPEDPASARMGESVYSFALRELPGTFMRGWEQETIRLRRKGLPVWSFHNDILQGYAIGVALVAAATAIFGWVVLPFILLHHFVVWYSLTQANYVEHYGLLRQKKENGKYEPCQPHHSWNTNHIVSNLLSFHLQRHSDHHANPQRPYQALRDFPDLPRLPSGYPGCFGLAAIPPLWFRVMDPKVIAWADGDIEKVNLDPAKSDALKARYGGARMEKDAAPA
ncbi:MAG: alkane 1-monooxygenase [Pseudomonadota bacterium]